MDVLSDILRTMRLRATVFMHACFRGEWAIDTSGEKKATFHMVSRGACWLHLPNLEQAIALASGDLVVFPHDAVHTISNSEQPPAANIPRNQTPNPEEKGPGATIICGYFEFERHHWNPLLDALPEVLVIHNEESANVPLMETLERVMTYEVESEQLGSALLIDKLSEILFIHVIRCYLRHNHENGFIAALADAQIGKALGSIHENPAHHWNVKSLAKEAGLSRSAFAERFNRMVGMAPIQYLTHWRMTQAHEIFISTHESVARVASSSGYQSEVAFAKAFKKHFGYGPGEVRRKRG